MTGTPVGELLAIDLGTSGVKVGLFARDGQLLRFRRRTYPLQRLPNGWAEQDPETWWATTCAAIHDVLEDFDAGQLQAVCAGGQGPVLVLVDDHGRPTRPAISWLDTRAEPERTWLSAQVGGEVTPWSLVPRLMWVAEHEPEVLAQSRWALQAWDFLGYRLAGGMAAVASTLPGYAVWDRGWLTAAGFAKSPLIPPPAVAGEAYAVTGGSWAAECGLPPGIRVVGSMDDGNGSLIGAAGWVKGRAADVGGTAGGLALCWDVPLTAPGVGLWPSMVPGTYTLGGVFAAGGRAVDWWTEASGGADVPATLALAAQARAGSDGLVFVPFLAGERSPYWDSSARGAFLGLTFAHGPAQLARAVVESSGYSLRLLCEAVTDAGARIDELRVCGTQARSRFWNQVKADVTGYQVQVPRVKNVALMSNAIQGAVGAGLYPDIISAGNAMVQVVETLDPVPAHHAVYDELFGVYRQAYGSLKPFFEPLGRVGGAAR